MAAAAAAAAGAPLVGFDRPEMYSSPLVGTVSLYQRHVFLCYKDASSWPSQVESAELGALPHSLFAAFKAHKNKMTDKVRITLCEVAASSEGDVLIFPDMLCYRGLNAANARSFVEDVLVKQMKWNHGKTEQLTGSHVFVCSHGSRDARCGSCGPVLVDKFRIEIAEQGLDALVSVKACSHIGGHKFAGNVIIFGGNPMRGDWYGYVTPNDVSLLLDKHIQRGEIVERLWRGQMSLTEEEQRQSQELRQGEERCPCGSSLSDCGASRQQKKREAKQDLEVPKKDKHGRGRWTAEDKMTVAALVLGAATAMGLCYYYMYNNTNTK